MVRQAGTRFHRVAERHSCRIASRLSRPDGKVVSMFAFVSAIVSAIVGFGSALLAIVLTPLLRIISGVVNAMRNFPLRLSNVVPN